jgi:YVTN family beta-propeller protein
MAFDAGRVWVANQTQNTLTVVDATTNSVVDRIDMSQDAPGPADRAPSSVTFADGVAWVVEHRADALARVDPTSTVTRTCIGSPDPGAIVAAGGALWVADSGGVVSLMDAARGEVQARLGLPGATAGDLVADETMVWVAAGSAVVGIDVRTQLVAAVALLGDFAASRDFAGGVSIALSADSVWTTDPTGNGLVRISKASAD